MKQILNLIHEIMNPTEEFTPIPFWFFNDAPDKAKIEKQLEDYVEKGVNGIVLHPRIGIPKEIPYLSEAFFEVVEYVVATASRLNMKIVLYDEGMYPSGSAHGMVVAADPDFASKGIILTEDPSDKEVIAALSNGMYLVKDFTKGTIRGIHFGEDDGECCAPPSADILNPHAVAKFILITHDLYYKKLDKYFGNTIIGFFTDEPCALGRNAGEYREWADGMEKEIVEAGGTLKELEGLFTGKENKSTIIYHKLIKKHLRETFYAPLSNWCQEHGIMLMGHPAESDDVEEELYFHVPGQDLILRRITPKSGGLLESDSVQAKLSADIARHLGRRRNANECFGVCGRNKIPWYFTGEDMKWYIDWLGIRGVNLYIPHAFYYSVEGKRKEERPPDVGPHNIWWKHYRRFSDYMKRLSYLMTDSENNAKVAVLCDNNKVPFMEVKGLYENQIEFNYLPAALIPACEFNNGKIKIQGYQYDVILNVIGEEYDSLLLDVNNVHQVEELLDNEAAHSIKTILTDLNHPDLRAVHLVKHGIDMYLLSNEGEKEIMEQVTFPAVSYPVVLDLWNGEYYHPISRKTENGTQLMIHLTPCETQLIVSDMENEIKDNKKREDKTADWTNLFTLIKRDGNKAEYEYTFQLEQFTGSEAFKIRGEEMVECYCNGKFAGVSFWNAHNFLIGPYLQEGTNTVTLHITGNAANIYAEADVYYGLDRD